jgi:hypothetical protein
MRRRVERHWEAVFRLRRALQRDAGALCRAYLAARNERAAAGNKAVRGRLGLDRKGIEAQARIHVERARWMRHHLTKATALHVAAEVWQSCDRFLFRDSAGQRHGMPRAGSWRDLRRIPGRARSHTKPHLAWETYRLVGSLQGHLGAHGTQSGLTVAEAAALEPGQPVLAQPRHLPAPTPPEGGWQAYDGALAVIYTGLPGGDLVMPVRLPQGAGQFARLAHFLASPQAWHKIDLVRVGDRRAPGGWRYQAHLTILGTGWASPATAASRAAAPAGRLGGVDGNVSSLAVASLPVPGAEGNLLTTHIRITGAQRAAAGRAANKARGRSRAMQRSRRASNAAQYQLSKKQRARADRRKKAVLPERPSKRGRPGQPSATTRQRGLVRAAATLRWWPLPGKGKAPPNPATDPTATRGDLGGPGGPAAPHRSVNANYESTLRPTGCTRSRSREAARTRPGPRNRGRRARRARCGRRPGRRPARTPPPCPAGRTASAPRSAPPR